MLKADLIIVGAKPIATEVFIPSGLGGALRISFGIATALTG